MIFLAGVRVHRVEHNVRMDMPPIHMGGNYCLVTVQMLRSESLGNFQSQLGRDFTGLEGLDDMVILDTIFFSCAPFGLQHLTALPAWFTALMGCEDLLLRLIAVEDVVDPDIQPTFSSQDLGDSHYGLATWYINS